MKNRLWGDLQTEECLLKVNASNLHDNETLLTTNVRFIGVKTLSRKCTSICIDNGYLELWKFEILKNYFTGNFFLFQCPFATDGQWVTWVDKQLESSNSRVSESLNYSLTTSVTRNLSERPTNQLILSVLLIEFELMPWIKGYFVIFAVTEKEFVLCYIWNKMVFQRKLF